MRCRRDGFGGKVDTAETGVDGDFKLFTIAPLDIQERCTSDMTV